MGERVFLAYWDDLFEVLFTSTFTDPNGKFTGGTFMRIRKPGKIDKNLWRLGNKESCIYLLEGTDHSMIVSGGMSCIVPDVLRQLETFHIDERRIKKLLILHAHFDHVGIVPFFKRRHPDIEVFASERAWDLLNTPQVRATINKFGRAVSDRLGANEAYETYDLDWRDDITGTAVYAGDKIGFEDAYVNIYETPGHSSCSISAYQPQLKALFASDASGIPYRDMIISSGNSDFTKYQQSLEKLKGLDVKYMCADHYGYLTGDEAQVFLQNAIKAAKERRSSIEDIFRRTGDMEATVQEMLDEFYKENPDYILTPEISRGVYRQMVRHISNAIQE
jgi:glyoxylase-like metal-dependent hydrolase (beta-lactamase superfamily II)